MSNSQTASPGSDEPGRLLPPSRGKRRSVLEDTLKDISATLERSLFAEEISSRPGLMQSLDPRIKLLGTFVLILAVSLSRSLVAIAGLYVVALIIAALSKVPLDIYIKRVWLALPFFTGMVILPAIFITPGPPVATLPFGLVITQTGLTSALFLLFRVSTSVSLTLLMILTTAWNTLLSALTVMRIPDTLILILGMTYRYIYVLLHITNDMFLSRKSRVVGRLSTDDERRMLGATAGMLLNKSLDMSSEVYLAMQSRGFTGSARMLRPFKMQPRDWAWGVGVIALAVAVSIMGQ